MHCSRTENCWVVYCSAYCIINCYTICVMCFAVDLWQTFEVDSLEHLEALEQVTQRLERHVNLCKAHVLMVTSFDVKPKCRRKLRHRPTIDHTAFAGI